LDFNLTDQLLIIYSVFIKYLSKNGEKMSWNISYFLINFKKAYNSVRREVLYNILTEFQICETTKANKKCVSMKPITKSNICLTSFLL
jgi:hypothetical protein